MYTKGVNWLDIVILVILVGSAFAGWRTGLIRSLLSLIGLVVGIKLAGLYYLSLAPRLSFVPDERAARIIAFVIVLAIVMLAALVLGWLLTKIVSSLTLGWLNGLGGMVFGLGMGAISVGALLAIWVRFFGMNQAISDSGLARLLINQLAAFLALLPSEFDVIRTFLN
ncbi:MAG: CvpA family protein [Dehalococcoidales bacterium]|nr:CvpA family protein [Dehalococcoidales bacterium]